MNKSYDPYPPAPMPSLACAFLLLAVLVMILAAF
jgi:hypothetical protein